MSLKVLRNPVVGVITEPLVAGYSIYANKCSFQDYPKTIHYGAVITPTIGDKPALDRLLRNIRYKKHYTVRSAGALNIF